MIGENMTTNLVKQVDDIIDRIDVAAASELLKELAHLSPEEKYSLGNVYNDSLIKLQIVDFLDLSNSEAAAIVRNHLLVFFRIDLPFEQRLTARYVFQGMTEKNNQRKIIKQAILENQEKLGNFTIGEWLKKFDQQYNVDEREDQDIINFFLTDKDAALLGEMEKNILKSIFHTYDTLIATELIDIFDAVEMLKNLNRAGANADFSSALSVSQFQPQSRYQRLSSQTFKKAPASFREEAMLVNLTLSEALRIHPEIGEQLITSQKINLRSFPYPVRPSIKNWLADYTSNLGYEKHGSMDRSQYLFQGANAKKLSVPERNKLAYLLKAFDENSPITINKNTSQVIFPTITPAGEPASNAARWASKNTTNVVPASRPSSEINPPKALSDQFRPVSAPQMAQKNINSMQFSYPQKLPYEKSLAAPAPIKTLSSNIPAKQEPWKISAQKTFVPSVPAKTPPPETAIKSSPWRLPAEKTFTPATPAKNLSQNAPIKSSPWKFPDKPASPPSPPKNVVDLKNINQ
jgi:hypothetical protein